MIPPSRIVSDIFLGTAMLRWDSERGAVLQTAIKESIRSIYVQRKSAWLFRSIACDSDTLNNLVSGNRLTTVDIKACLQRQYVWGFIPLPL